MTKSLDTLSLSEIVELSELEIQSVAGGVTSTEFALTATSIEHAA